MKQLALMVAATILATPAAHGELLTNPGFEDTNADNSHGDGWGSFGAAGFHAFFGPNGHASLFADNTSNSGGVFQLGIPGTPGQPYHFELSDTRIESNFDARLQFGLEFWDAGEANKISETLVQVPDPGVEVNGGVYDMTAAAPAGTAFVRPIIRFDMVGSSGGQRNVFVFDASLTAVPEPAALLLTAPGLLAAAFTRHRRHLHRNDL